MQRIAITALSKVKMFFYGFSCKPRPINYELRQGEEK
jgi:hypothetical protein